MALAPGHLLTGPAGRFLPDMLDDPPAAQDQLQRLGVIFAQLAQPSTAAAQAGGGCWLAHALARHMRRERLARWALAGEGRDVGRACGRLLGGDFVRGGQSLKLIELYGHLLDQPHTRPMLRLSLNHHQAHGRIVRQGRVQGQPGEAGNYQRRTRR